MGIFEMAPQELPLAKIVVVGVGGAGGNTVNTMVEEGIEGVNIVVVNTDLQDLIKSRAQKKIQIGKETTRGLGTGFDPEKGKKAAEESLREIEEMFKGIDMVFITAGMGGGTGTGASSTIAKAAKQSGAVTVSVVTLPFNWEGRKRFEVATRGVKELSASSDTILVIHNDNIRTLYSKQITAKDAFKYVDGVLVKATKGVSDLIIKQGQINLDFADIKRVMGKGGKALMGIGYGIGEDRAVQAANEAINSPLLDDVSITEASSVLVNITGPEDLKLEEIDNVMQLIQEKIGDDGEKEILFGIRYDSTYNNRLEITIIATGIGAKKGKKDIRNIGIQEVVSEKEGQLKNSLDRHFAWTSGEENDDLFDSEVIEAAEEVPQESEEEKENRKKEIFNKRQRLRKNRPIEDELDLYNSDELIEPAYLRRQNN
ncbi:cell division protein FtsZ [candidate division WOR-3 bacterium]|nr:cell division protein FtsZ [candidate division WOR-3 bacterium]